MTNISLDELGRNIQNLDDVVAILDHVLSADPIYVSLEEIKELGLNNIT
jgi:DNA invertase Pin-like site-specific DNA recombinase